MSNTIDSTNFQQDTNPGNFIVKTYDMLNQLGEKTEKLAKYAGQHEDDIQVRWKKVLADRRVKEEEMSGMHMRAAYISMILMAANVGCSVGGTIMGVRAETAVLAPSVKAYTKSGGEVLSSLGRAVGDHGSRLADGIQQSKTQLLNSKIDADREMAQKLWEFNKIKAEQDKEKYNQLEQKVKQGIEDVIRQTAGTYSVTR